MSKHTVFICGYSHTSHCSFDSHRGKAEEKAESKEQKVKEKEKIDHPLNV